MTMPEAPPAGSIAALLHRLTSFQDLLRSAARRSWRFSWFSWGFLFAVVIGEGVGSLLAFFSLAAAASGASSSPTILVWIYPVSILPSVVLLALSVREILLGRREARTGESPIRPSAREAPSSPGAGWTEVVQRSQQLLAQMRSEAEVAFVPLILGGFTAMTLVASLLLAGFVASDAFLVFLAVIPFLLLLIPFYLAVRGWIRGYQTVLDRQVGSLSGLEQEFFTRFAGISPDA